MGNLYWVRPQGSDSGDGSGAGAWRTLQHALDTMQPGDTALCGPGTFFENITFPTAGTATDQISLVGNGVAIIDGTYSLPSGTVVAGTTDSVSTHTAGSQTGLGYVDEGLCTIEVPYVKLSNFEIRNSSGHGVKVNYDGVDIKGVVITCDIYSNRGQAIKIVGASGDNARVNDLDLSTMRPISGNCNFFPYSRADADMAWLPVISVDSASNVRFESNEFHENWGPAIRLTGDSDDIIVSDCTLNDNFGGLIEILHATNVRTYRNNFFWSRVDTYSTNNAPPAAIIIDMDGSGAAANGDIDIYNNFFFGRLDVAVHFGGTTATQAGLIKVRNNTGYLRNSKGAYSNDGTLDSSYSNIQTRNNAFEFVNGTDAESISGSPSNITGDYNGWYPLLPATIDGVNDVTADPLFISPIYDYGPSDLIRSEELDGFIPSPSSPLIQAADSTFAPVEDAQFRTRDGSNPDIGAIEAEDIDFPVITEVPNQSTTTGVSIDLQLNATNPAEPEALAWTASPLPPGLIFNASTAQITGIPTTPGTYSVGVRAEIPSSGAYDTEAWEWTIKGAEKTRPIFFADDNHTGNEVIFRATIPVVINTGATYAWDFGDSNTSSSPNANHTYAAPGTYLVTYTITYNDGIVSKRKRKIRVGGQVSTYT